MPLGPCRWIGWAWLLFGLFQPGPALAADAANPLAPVDTASPRATLSSFQEAVRDVAGAMLGPEPFVDEQAFSRLRGALDRAALCLDLSQVARERVDDVAEVVPLQLLEVLDRIDIPPLEEIPDSEQVKARALTRWVLPGTEIALAKVEEGPRAGAWLFSADTVARVGDFYGKVRALPYRPDATVGSVGRHGGMYEYLRAFPEFDSFISQTLIDRLPPVWRSMVAGQPIWKWLGTVLTIGVGLLAFGLLLLFCGRMSRRSRQGAVGRYLLRFLPPVAGLGIALLIDHVVDEEIGLTGVGVAVIETVMWALAVLSLAWAVIALGNVAAEVINASKRIDPEGVDASLIRIVARIVSALLSVWIVVGAAERFGLSVAPLLAGLGIGGLAIALAVRPTLENVIGGLMLFADRPVRVGDLCRFGEQIGFIEEVGLRSTRIRTLEDTILSVPNAEFSQLRLENLSRRRKIQLLTTLGLRYETTSEQLRFVLASLRRVMLAHPMIGSDALRVRFVRFGDYSLDIEVHAYVRTRNPHEYLAVCEDLNLRIIDVVREAGADFAFPSQTTYLARDRPGDPEAVRAAEAEVARWRAEGKLPFPEFDLTHQWSFENTLEYPPTGSPGHKPVPGVPPDASSKGGD